MNGLINCSKLSPEVDRRRVNNRRRIVCAAAEGIENATKEQLARLDRKRKKKTSNDDWTNPNDPSARITKMKDGRTKLAYKAEHAVDLASGAVLAVTVQAADRGDTASYMETLAAAQREATQSHPVGIEEVVMDKGYHSLGVEAPISRPTRQCAPEDAQRIGPIIRR